MILWYIGICVVVFCMTLGTNILEVVRNATCIKFKILFCAILSLLWPIFIIALVLDCIRNYSMKEKPNE